ncbi:hypothetical protein A2U01_0062069, partial [Trifolium medium]|nr:hypothetical protein [Trifolium medium]
KNPYEGHFEAPSPANLFNLSMMLESAYPLDHGDDVRVCIDLFNLSKMLEFAYPLDLGDDVRVCFDLLQL